MFAARDDDDLRTQARALSKCVHHRLIRGRLQLAHSDQQRSRSACNDQCKSRQ